MMYEVIRHFTDLQDINYKYVEGDTYPREGYTPTKKRIAELASDKNKQKTALIKEIEEAPEVIETETVETSAEEENEKPKKKRSKKAE